MVPKQNAILDKATECLHTFNAYIDSATTVSWPQDQLDRFNLWVVHGGIFGDYNSRTSMDWRLRDRPELVETILLLLELLQGYLRLSMVHGAAPEALSSTEEPRTQPMSVSAIRSPAQSTDSSRCSIVIPPLEPLDAPSDPVEAVKRDAEETITKLFRLSALISSADMGDRYQKADNYVQLENDVNLTQKFRDSIKPILKHKSPPLKDFVYKRLLESICLRQRQIAYSRRHNLVSSPGTTHVSSAEDTPVIPPRFEPNYRHEENGTSSGVRRAADASNPLSRENSTDKQGDARKLALYSASYVPTTVLETPESLAAKAVHEVLGTIDDSLDTLPPPPAAPDKSKEFACPFCGVALEKALSQGSLWRSHVLKDLRPYVCVLPGCKTPCNLYADGFSWVNHMRTDHTITKWKCSNTFHTKPLIFDTKAEFTAHTQSTHEKFTEKEALELAKLSSFQVPRKLEAMTWSECPICAASLDGSGFMSAHCHIAKDLLSFAFYSLPEGLEPEDSQSLQPSGRNSISSDSAIGQLRKGEAETAQVYWSLLDADNSAEAEKNLQATQSELGTSLFIPPEDIQQSNQVPETIQIENSERMELEPEPSHNLRRNYPEDIAMDTNLSGTPSGALSRTFSRNVSHRSRTSGSQSRPFTSSKMSKESATIADRVLSKYNELRWIPRNFGRELLKDCDIDTLVKEMRTNKSPFQTGETRAFKEFISNKAPQLCIMLIYFDKFELIEQFYRHSIDDSHFPLEAQQIVGSLNKMRIAHPSSTLDIDWRSSHSLFCAKHASQHEFFIPVLDWRNFDAPPLDSELPYLCEPELISSTTFSVVRRTTIHAHHIDMKMGDLKVEVDDHGNPLAAIKELRVNTMTPGQFENLVRYEYKFLSKLRGPRFETQHLIKAAAFYRRQDGLFFVFPWAPHGNLRVFWNEQLPKAQDQTYVKWLFAQFCGIAETIRSLHRPEINIRHGDLKPENILCFGSSKKKQSGDPKYVFVISDVGLAREHEKLTQFRSRSKGFVGGTLVYAAPEMELHQNRATSRRYDMWSLGCIYLEFIIWLLHGKPGLDKFSMHRNGRFYIVREDRSHLTPSGAAVKAAEVNPAVMHWISNAIKVSRTDSGKDSAVSHLLVLIRDRLLVVDAAPDKTDLRSTDNDEFEQTSQASEFQVRVERQATIYEINVSSGRAYAEEVFEKISKIIEQAETGEIEWVGQTTPQMPDLPSGLSKPMLQGHEYEIPALNGPSEYVPDEEAFREAIASSANLATASKDTNLCTRCRSLPILSPDCIFEDTVGGLTETSTQCDLCRLLCHVLESRAEPQDTVLRFLRFGSTIRVDDKQSPPILSIYDSTRKERSHDSKIQVGHPKLSSAGDSNHVSILDGWLRHCDRDHDCLHLRDDSFFPTRLLDVGFAASQCRLVCNTDALSQDSRYLALSHRWGIHPDPSLADKIVCTYESNLQDLVKGVDDARFPPLYQDAIIMARKLGVGYLWIDSLCIIQAEPDNPDDEDQGQDFLKEAGKMELVFSSAYATIAATCARSPAENFLRSRPERRFATIPTERGQYYLAEVIDKFSEDIDQSELNSRGWVFQERALSRRTIYFAETQTYWECGKGVRCETRTWTDNIKSALLGDANFPSTLPDLDKGKRMKLFQSLYERYSKLQFTYPTDRPIAIRGLETRLLHALNTSGGFGVFEEYLHRGILWQRDESNLPGIDFSQSPGRNAHAFVPSWSWMAYDGPIRYMDIPAAAEWAAWHGDVTSPWERDDVGEGVKPHELRVLVRNLLDLTPSDLVILDDQDHTSRQDLKCVVVGSKRAPDPMQAEVYYSLIVAPSGGDGRLCQRVGVAFLEKRQIDWHSPVLAMGVR